MKKYRILDREGNTLANGLDVDEVRECAFYKLVNTLPDYIPQNKRLEFVAGLGGSMWKMEEEEYIPLTSHEWQRVIAKLGEEDKSFLLIKMVDWIAETAEGVEFLNGLSKHIG